MPALAVVAGRYKLLLKLSVPPDRFSNVPLKSPLKLPLKFAPVALFVTTAPGICSSGTVPLNWLVGNAPSKLLAVFAKMAYGVGMNCCRGASVANAPLPLVRTPISSQRSLPSNGAPPKFRMTSNKPLLTATVELVSSVATGFPFVAASYSANRKS